MDGSDAPSKQSSFLSVGYRVLRFEASRAKRSVISGNLLISEGEVQMLPAKLLIPKALEGLLMGLWLGPLVVQAQCLDSNGFLGWA